MSAGCWQMRVGQEHGIGKRGQFIGFQLVGHSLVLQCISGPRTSVYFENGFVCQIR